MINLLRRRYSFWLDLFLFGLFAVLITTGLVLEISIESFYSGIELPAAFFVPGLILIILSGSHSEPGPSLTFSLGAGMAILSFMGMSVVVTLFRYRLYDVDVIINQTHVYGLLTAVLALTYFAIVALLEQGFRFQTGQDSPLVIVISTLLIAGLFTHLRGRLQDFVDWRFYHPRYNTEKTLAQFMTSARNEVDLDELTAELLSTVNQTMRPVTVTRWLKDTGGLHTPKSHNSGAGSIEGQIKREFS